MFDIVLKPETNTFDVVLSALPPRNTVSFGGGDGNVFQLSTDNTRGRFITIVLAEQE